MREWRKKQLRINPVKYKLQAMVRRAKVRAKKKDIPFTLDWEELIPLAKDKCPYFTEIKLDWGNKEKGIRGKVGEAYDKALQGPDGSPLTIAETFPELSLGNSSSIFICLQTLHLLFSSF